LAARLWQWHILDAEAILRPMKPLEYPNTSAAMLEHLRARLSGVVPDVELRLKAELALEVNRLKREKNAVILGHNYMESALFHSVPDYTGDSLQLSRIAAETNADIIVFCGVRFMAETAKILNPNRLVLLPSEKGGCSLATALTGADVKALRKLYPGAPVVSYVNTYADVKAETDICCTSSNATAVVRHLLSQGHRQIIFLPDEYLARNIAQEIAMAILFPVRGPHGLERPAISEVPEPVMIGWHGRCEVHEKYSAEDVHAIRQQFPDAAILAHPECSPDVVRLADFAGSTTAMIRYVEKLASGRYFLFTECTMGDNIVGRNPNCEMIRLCAVRCPHMNEITLEQTLQSLRQERYAIELPEEIRVRARASLDRMIGIG
jgi:quinolinate synthase